MIRKINNIKLYLRKSISISSGLFKINFVDFLTEWTVELSQALRTSSETDVEFVSVSLRDEAR
jgi:hypothetical protein